MALPLQEALAAKREHYEEEGVWQRFLLESYTGCGGYMGRVKQPPAGYWGSASEAYSTFSFIRSDEWFSRVHESNSYLDRFPREDLEKFERRKGVAHYLNYCRPITNLLVSYIVRKPLDRTGVPQRLADWIKSSGYDKRFRKRALTATVLGWFPVLVDLPSVAEDVTSAADAGTLEPYVVEMLPCHLTDYQLDDRGEFIWAKFTTSEKRKAAWNAEPATITKHSVWTRGEWVTYEQSGTGDAKETGRSTHSFGRVPVIAWRAATSVEDKVKAASIIADLAVEGRRLFNLTSEMDEHIRGQVFALLAVPRRVASGEGEDADIGTENGLEFDPDTKHLPQFIAPPQSVAATLETRMTNSIIEIYRIGRVEYDRASGTASSAQSKQQNFEQTNALLADLAAALAEADYETLYTVGLGLGLDPTKGEKDGGLAELSCTAHSSYATDDLTVELQQTIDALTIREFGREARVLILKRAVRTLIPNMTADEQKLVDDDIERAVDQAEKDAEAMQEASMAAASEPNDNGDNETDPQDPSEDSEQKGAAA